MTTSEKFSRERQRALLEAAQRAYPDHTLFGVDVVPYARDVIRADIAYLAGHGLLEEMTHANGRAFRWRITSAGIDFLADDGGLSAILGVVTVKLHPDTLRELLVQRATQADGDATVKDKVVEQLKSLPAEGIQALGQKLIAEGLQRLPNALQWLQTALLPG